MTDEKIIDALLSNKEGHWDSYVQNNSNTNGDLFTAQQQFPGQNQWITITVIRNQDFIKTDFKKKEFSNFRFDSIDFNESNLKHCKFTQCEFNACDFSDANLSDTSFTKVTINNCNTNQNTSFENSFIKKSTLIGFLQKSNFKNGKIIESNLTQFSLLELDIRGTSLRRSNLSGTSWEKATIDTKTNFDLTQFDSHPVTRDKSELILYPNLLVKWVFNWRTTRAIGKLPVFEFSWVLFLISLFIINSIAILNNANPVIFEGFNKIPIPNQISCIIFSTLLLITGSTIYKIACPEEVKEFSEVQWVYEHQHPRVLYISKSLQSPVLQAICTMTLLLGGTIGLWIVGIKIFHALSYIFS